MNILFVTPEVVPFSKTGGLADVAGALPRALNTLGHDVRIITPRYRAVDPKRFALRFALRPRLERVSIPAGARHGDVHVFETEVPGTQIPVYFVDQPAWFDRDGLYQDRGVDYPDNLERFSGFSQAVLRTLPQLGWQPQVVHCHDWQTALVCAALALTHADDPFWHPARTVLTVHNLAYQGLFPREAWPLTSLPEQAFQIEGLEFYGQINCLKGGLVYADCLSTVSPTYAREIQSPEYGCGLDGVLRVRRGDLAGILNGIDPEEWNPRTDPHLPAHYSLDELAGKSLCKLALQNHLGLPQRHGVLIGMIQRLAEQKGIELFIDAIEPLLRLELQIVILGTGDPVYHEKLSELVARDPERLFVHLRFDNALAHQIEAGCDAFLMPSRFEPCGLNQMYSMRYGTVPIVRRVGGLADTVVDVSPATLAAGEATGFVFEEYSAQALIEAVTRAVAAFRDHRLWAQLVAAGMQRDFSWTRSARAYVDLYERALAKPSRRHARPHAQNPLQPASY